ncbi:hypothetical protein BH11BAC7_BH11BAC7_14150 [soil metagenome]
MRLNSPVDDLVKYASSTSRIELGEVNLNTVMKDVLEDFELLSNENGAVITVHALTVISADDVQMWQVFSNFIANSIKYRKADIAPEITNCIDAASPNKKYYKVIVHDNGIGIDAIFLNKIFTIFARLHMPDEYSGNGIGLAICKKIMENQSGKITVESTPNMGSIFNLFFPVN